MHFTTNLKRLVSISSSAMDRRRTSSINSPAACCNRRGRRRRLNTLFASSGRRWIAGLYSNVFRAERELRHPSRLFGRRSPSTRLAPRSSSPGWSQCGSRRSSSGDMRCCISPRGALLKRHSRSKTPVVKIAKAMKRTQASIRQKAASLGFKIGHQR